MIYVNSHGRMANQYFQYAFARAIQLHLLEKYNVKHEISINFGSEGNLLKHTKAKFMEVKKIKKHRLIYIINLIAFLFYKSDDRKYKLSKTINKLFNRFGIIYGPVGYSIFKLYNKRDIILDGYFQSEKYFNKYKDVIKEELRNVDSKDKKFNDYFISLDFENSVCVHIRRGDYVDASNQDKFLICGPKYYEKAIRIIESKIKNPTFYVFSDDIEWVKNNIKFNSKVIYEDYNFRSTDNFKIMYNCKNFILSNSSYSWWSQYLSDAKLIIAPSRWNGETNNRDIYLDNWEIANCDNEVKL